MIPDLADHPFWGQHMRHADLAGLDTSKVRAAWRNVFDRSFDGKVIDGAMKSADARLKELAKKCWSAIRKYRQALENWYSDTPKKSRQRARRLRHVAHFGERLRHQLRSMGGERLIWWYAWRLRRWCDLFGVKVDLTSKVKVVVKDIEDVIVRSEVS